MMYMERMSDMKEATMSTTTSADLARAWAERVRSGAFSPAVAGTREVRVFGQAGDAPVIFPPHPLGAAAGVRAR